MAALLDVRTTTARVRTEKKLEYDRRYIECK